MGTGGAGELPSLFEEEEDILLTGGEVLAGIIQT